MIEKFISDPTTLGVTGLLSLALYLSVRAFLKETIVPGGAHRLQVGKLEARILKLEETIESKDQELMDTKYRLIGHAEKATDLAQARTARPAR